MSMCGGGHTAQRDCTGACEDANFSWWPCQLMIINLPAATLRRANRPNMISFLR